jgi:hypothetical protein
MNWRYIHSQCIDSLLSPRLIKALPLWSAATAIVYKVLRFIKIRQLCMGWATGISLTGMFLDGKSDFPILRILSWHLIGILALDEFGATGFGI